MSGCWQGWGGAVGGRPILTSAPPSRKTPNTYQYVVSEPLGRSTYKERYLFVFR